jgi:glycerol kinase
MEQDSGIKLNVLRVDGGMVENDLLMQFQSDILDCPVVRPQAKEMTALGAAYAAGLATGFFTGTAQLRSQWKTGKTWNPKLDDVTRERKYRSWKKSVTRSFDWLE